MTALNEIVQNATPWTPDNRGAHLSAIADLRAAWNDAAQLAEAGATRESLSRAASSSVRAMATWHWDANQLLLEFGIADAQQPRDWGVQLASALNQQPVDAASLWRDRIAQFAEEADNAADAAEQLAGHDKANSDFLASLSGIVAEALATTLMVAVLIDEDWEALAMQPQ